MQKPLFIYSVQHQFHLYNRSSYSMSTSETFLLSFIIYSLHQACMSNTDPEEKVQHPQINTT